MNKSESGWPEKHLDHLTPSQLQSRIDEALSFAKESWAFDCCTDNLRYFMDQVVRSLTGTDYSYQSWVDEESYGWNPGERPVGYDGPEHKG